MPTIEYRIREGSFFRGDIKDVAERIESLKKRHATAENTEGYVTPDEIVEDAKDPKSPLHPHFTWDEFKAARLYNIEEARKLIRAYEVVITESDHTPIVISPANVVVRNQAAKSSYVSSSYAVSNEDTRYKLFDECIGLIKGAQRRLASLKGISQETVAILGQAIEAIERDKEKQDKPATGKPKGRKKGDEPPNPFSTN